MTIQYSLEALTAFIDNIDPSKLAIRTHKKINYYNVATSFDIETTSAYNEAGEKVSWVYIWQFAFGDDIIYGRDIEGFIKFCEVISTHLNLCNEKRLIVYVHNLAHEFAFICKYFVWDEVFAIDTRKPVSALTNMGIMFKCSYLLTNQSLDMVAKNLTSPMKKLTGNLDYNLVRTTATPLNSDELAYCLEDVKIVVALIREKIEDAGDDITKIPLTATGYVREAVRKNCLYNYKKGDGRANKHGDQRYKKIMDSLQITAEEYALNKRAFMGGFTHANAINVNRTHTNVYAFDITSSYPAVMLSERYPMSRGKFVSYTTPDEFNADLRSKCMIFELTLHNVRLKNIFGECYISRSKCEVCEDATINNGRLVKARIIKTVVTNIDFELIQELYDFDDFLIGECVVYEKNYLPEKFLESVLDFYVKKTSLKGVEGKEKEYILSKSLLNSCYGMCVTDIVRDENTYNDGWETTPANPEEQIEKYNASKNRFLFYPWGVFVTAYARRNLFKLINECGNDFIYSDTDSVKFLNLEKHIDFINSYNENITKKVKRCLQVSKLNPALSSPEDINGIKHPIGVYDSETKGYKRFKTLGAKRYLYEDEKGYHLTCAGVNKTAGAKYLATFEDPFTAFDNGLDIPGDATGKLTHTYIDDPVEGDIIDYMGNLGHYKALSGVHLSPAEYSLTISDNYLSYTSNLQELFGYDT